MHYEVKEVLFKHTEHFAGQKELSRDMWPLEVSDYQQETFLIQ